MPRKIPEFNENGAITMCTVEIKRSGGNNGSIEIFLEGRLGKDEVKTVMDSIMQELGFGSKFKHVTVDISSIEWIDTAGVALLVLICSRVRERNGVFRVVNPNERVLRVFRLAQVEKLLSVENGNDR